MVSVGELEELIVRGNCGIGYDNISLLKIGGIVRAKMEFDTMKTFKLLYRFAELLGWRYIRYYYLCTGSMCKFGDIDTAAEPPQAHDQNCFAGEELFVHPVRHT